MSTKTISLSEDAYENLKSMKSGKESFSDVVRKLTNERSLLEIAGIWKDKELGKTIEKTREKSEKEIDKIAERLK